MQPHPIESIMRTTMEQIKQMVDVNTIVGAPIETPNGTVIVPISKVSFGFVAGGGEYGKCHDKNMKMDEDNSYPFAGGAGAGVCLHPMAFLVVNNNNVELLPVSYPSTYDRIIELVPRLINDLQQYFKKNGADSQQG